MTSPLYLRTWERCCTIGLRVVSYYIQHKQEPIDHHLLSPSDLGLLQNVMESTSIATIHCPDVEHFLFVIPLVTHIPYHVPCTFLIVIVSYWVILFLVRILAHSWSRTPSGYFMLPTMYYWISISGAIFYLFDSITYFVSYILSPLYLCSRT